MKKFVIAAAIALLSANGAMAAKPPRCNPAVQNWENGSKDTCVYHGGSSIGMQSAQSTRPNTTTPDTPEDLNDILR